MSFFFFFSVLKVHSGQKDRSALEQYMKEIPPGSPEYLKAESALKVSCVGCVKELYWDRVLY